MNINNKFSHWTPDDEKEHFPSSIEWWCTETFFKTKKDNKKWSLKAVLSEWYEGSKIGSLFFTTLFDQENNKHFYYYRRDEKHKLNISKNNFCVNYKKSFFQGLYPNYKMYFIDDENNITHDIKQEAISVPRWIAQDITDGWLPLGLGSYRYGFIPKTKLAGSMKVNKDNYEVEGIGYIEHVWGNFNYDKAIIGIKNIPKTLRIYSKLIGWRIHHLKPCIPKSITFVSENNPAGYDWIWAILDNGWTLFFGNIMFWLMEGPSMGTLILSKDDKTYQEYVDVHFHYNNIKQSEIFDFKYPTDITIVAKKEHEELTLRFKMTCDIKEHIARFPKNKYWIGFVIVESPGIVEGFYTNKETKIKISGICKIEPQRQVSIFGHNLLKFEFLKPPKGVGISINLDSNFFKKNVDARIRLVPKPKIKLNIKKINDNKKKDK